MEKKYLMEAIVGNSRLLAGIGEHGELSRLFWPRIDAPQNISSDKLGLFIDEQDVCWLTNRKWQSEPSYIMDTNIYQVVLTHPVHNLKAMLTIFALPEEDVLVRRLEITNVDAKPHRLSLLHYSDLAIGESPRRHTAVFRTEEAALWQFKQNSHFLSGADAAVLAYQCNAGQIRSQQDLKGLSQFMSTDGAVLWQLGLIEPKETAGITLYTAMAANLDEAAVLLNRAKQTGYLPLLKNCTTYWQDYLGVLPRIPIENPALDRLYKRSLLIFPLLTDHEYGSMLAAPEADEDFTRCGGYGFCWGRDAAFITYAMDLAGLKKASRRFYLWAMRAQSKDGSWAQRHCLDGAVAPNWGLQIDETASIIWGMWQHYKLTSEEEVLAKFWPSLVKGADFLVSFIDEATGLPKPSYDLWEERKGEHTYSAAAVWAGLQAASEAACLYGAEEKAVLWQAAAKNLQTSILGLWDDESGCFLRGVKVELSKDEFTYLTAKQYSEDSLEQLWKREKLALDKDPIIDISLLGLCFPFGFLPADDPRLRKTAEKIAEKLTSPKIGGIKRYENDQYIGGNPWILCTLWLALYYIKSGSKVKAAELVEWVLFHQTKVGLLAEQIDKETGKPAWIIPLTWSHAMLILTVQLLYSDKES